MELIRVLPETWGSVIKVCRVFGVRSWEVVFISRATNDYGEPQLRVTKGKTYNTRGGVKEKTEPRWLEAAMAVDGTTFGLVESWDQLKPPPTVSGKTLGNVLLGEVGFIWTAKKALSPYGTTNTKKLGAEGATFAGTLQPFTASTSCALRSGIYPLRKGPSKS